MIFPYLIRPFIPTDYDMPPTIYSILNSIANFDSDTPPVAIKDLANNGRNIIFDFNYPLSSKISRSDFECMILNHFLMRRIGYQTLNAFKISLNVKLNEIMPLYNKLFDSIDGWDLFNDGEEVHHIANSNGNNNTTINSTNNSTSNSTDSNNSTDVSDRRFSELPQNELSNVRDGSYVTDYNYDTNSNNSTSNNQTTTNNNINSTNNSINENLLNETTTRTQHDKIEIYKKFLESKQNIYSMIFKDLDSLFYQLIS